VEGEHIDAYPAGEREEIRQLFARKGLGGSVLDEVVDAITRDRERWVDTMLTEELRLPLETPVPFRAAAVTLGCFLAAGVIPLLPLQVLGDRVSFHASAAITAVTFAAIGAVKGKVAAGSPWASALETLLVGGCAAFLAYAVGAAARSILA